MFPLLTGDGRFFVLAISQKHTRLLECSRDTFARVDVPDMPEGRDELMQYIDFEKSVQFHSGTQHAEAASGERAAIFHGQGGVEDDVKSRIVEYFRAVDQSLNAVLHDQRAPLIYAGVEALFAIFRDANSYAHLADTPIAGNPETIDDADLHARAWSIVSPQFNRDRDRAVERLQQAAETEHSATDLNAVVTTAFDGRIDVLFVADDQNRWGRYDHDARTVEQHDDQQPGDDGLLDAAAIRTFIQGGTVYAVPTDQLPPPASRDTPLAALLRY